MYEPAIATEVLPDGTKISQVKVRVYPDKNNLEESALMSQEAFADKVYFAVKDLYEDYEEKNFDIMEEEIDREGDGDIFGWALTDSWTYIGNVYYFLLSVFNLVEFSKDETPIIDSKGVIVGKMAYGMTFEILDTDHHTKLDPLDYETLQDAEGKWLRLHFTLRKVMDLPEKLSFKTKCKYQFLTEEIPFETKVMEKTKDPIFDYKGTHDVRINDELIQQLMYNSLTISVWGMIESKRKEIIKL
jgi:hypothetical protein